MDQKYTKDLYSTFVVYGNYAIYGISNLWYNSQFCFRRGHLASHSIMIVDNISKSLDKWKLLV